MLQFSASIRFKTSASLGALALSLAVPLTHANAAPDACGTVTDNKVDCDNSDAPFPTGIEYFVDEDLTVNFEDGMTIAPDGNHSAIIVTSAQGSVAINAANADFISKDAGAIGAVSMMGEVAVAVDDVTTVGDGAWGIATYAGSGATMIKADTVATDGAYGLGILAESLKGNISIEVNAIDTKGFASDGITARAGGDIFIDAGSIKGEGDYIWGINSYSGGTIDGDQVIGDTQVVVENIEISGNYAVGVNSTSLGATDIKVGSITLSGDNGFAVRAEGIGNTSVEIGEVNATGRYNGAVVAFSYGEANVKVGTFNSEHGGGIVAFGVEGAHAQAGKINTSGDFTNGIQAVSQYGNATVRVGEVSTDGFFSIGVNGDALRGDLIVEAGKITTKGELAMGIRAFGGTSSVTVTGPISTDGFAAFGILNATTHGDAIVRTGDTVTTRGTYSDALWIVGRYGTADIQTAGKVLATGENSRAIYAVGEDGQINLLAKDVETTGNGSDAIKARTIFAERFLGQPGFPDPVIFTGDIEVRADLVKAGGEGSMGISARGIGKAVIEAGAVSAFDNYAIETNMIEDSSITVLRSAISTNGSAIFAEGEDVTVNLAAGSAVTGGVHGIVVKAMGDRCVLRNPIDGSVNPCPNPGDDYGNPNPELAQFAAVPPGTAIINNDGTLKGGSGYAVKVEVGSLTLNNRGVLIGAVALGGGDDLINNSGTFDVTGDSDFGDGADQFINSGTVKIASLAAPKAYQFLGLERFENSGLLDLRNGVAGDSLSLAGNYVGSGEAKLGLDVDLDSGTSDKLVVGGAATGTTELALKLSPAEARLTGPGSILLVEVGSGSSANAFVMSEDAADIGFIRYGLRHDMASGRYYLTSAAGAGAYWQLNAIGGAETIWHGSTDAWRSNSAANRDSAWAGREISGRGRLWGQVYGSQSSRKHSATLAGGDRASLAYDQDLTGAQIGYDIGGAEGEASRFSFGAIAGHTGSSVRAGVSDEELDFGSFNIGAYATFSAGGLFGNVLAKYDWHGAKFKSEVLDLSEKVKGTTLGVETEVGFRLGNERHFIEPIASLSWTNTRLDHLEALGQVIDFDDRNALRGKAGARFGGRAELQGGGAIGFYGSAKAVLGSSDKYRLRLVSGDEHEMLSAKGVGTLAEGVIGVSYRSARGFETFAEGQGEVGSSFDSFGGRLGARVAL